MWLAVMVVVVSIIVWGLLIGVMVALVLIGRRMRQTWELLYPQNPHLPALPDATELFRDDGQHIEVGTKRDNMASMLLVWCLFIVVCGGWLLLIVRQPSLSLRDVEMVTMLALLIALLLLTGALNVARLLRHGPALLVTSDGIEDHVSLIGTGLGLVRWHEMYSVISVDGPGKGRGAGHQLTVALVNRRAVIRRQPYWKRLLYALFTRGHAPVIRISDRYLTMGAEELAELIDDFAEAHAPPGWEWPAVRRFLDGEDETSGEEAMSAG